MICRDTDADLARAFGIPDGLLFHGQVVHYPALVLLGPDGREHRRNRPRRHHVRPKDHGRLAPIQFPRELAGRLQDGSGIADWVEPEARGDDCRVRGARSLRLAS